MWGVEAERLIAAGVFVLEGLLLFFNKVALCGAML